MSDHWPWKGTAKGRRSASTSFMAPRWAASFFLASSKTELPEEAMPAYDCLMIRYGQFCAVARALEVLGERWTLLVVRELLLGASTFTEIRRGLPRIPRATLSTRLSSLVDHGIIESTTSGYCLTPSGAELGTVLR